MALRHSMLIGLILLGLLSSELVWAQTASPTAAPRASPASPVPSPVRAPPKAPARPPKASAKAPAKAPAPFVSQGLNFNAATTVSPYTWPGLILASTLVAFLAR